MMKYYRGADGELVGILCEPPINDRVIESNDSNADVSFCSPFFLRCLLSTDVPMTRRALAFLSPPPSLCCVAFFVSFVSFFLYACCRNGVLTSSRTMRELFLVTVIVVTVASNMAYQMMNNKGFTLFLCACSFHNSPN